MKSFSSFLKESPTNSVGANGYTNAAAAAGPVAGFDKKVWNYALSQDYQTPGESGLAKWRFSNIYPVEKLTLDGIDKMVQASKQFVDIQDDRNAQRVRKNFSSFREDLVKRVNQ
tara:strand:+ start:64 stop:405 length:342 start_codon:yes stop_codon:yes gene_type:complete